MCRLKIVQCLLPFLREKHSARVTVAGDVAPRVACVAAHVAVSLPCWQFFFWRDCTKTKHLQFFLF